jgi:hypothetical protein
LPSSDNWRELARDFRSLAVERDHDFLWAQWTSFDDGRTEWKLDGNFSFHSRFKALSARAAKELDPNGVKLLETWLDALRKEKPDVLHVLTFDGVGHIGELLKHLCAASADLCNAFEALAIEAEQRAQSEEAQRSDPRNWPPLLQELEALESIKSIHATPAKEISEALVRSLIAQREGITPEAVSQKQIRLEIAGLYPHYGPRIDLVSADPTPIPEPTPDDGPSSKVEQSTDPITEERTALLVDYKRECRECGIKVTDTMIAQAASSRWNERTPVQRWKRNDPRCTPGDDAKIRSVLKNKPHLAR